jgi:acyl-CoA dehydrogenase
MTFAGFGLSYELSLLRDLVARFVTERIRPVEEAIGPETRAIPDDDLVKLRAAARELGLWCLDAPQEYGGAGLSVFEYVVVLEQACKHRFCFPHAGGGAFGQSPPVVLYAGGPRLSRTTCGPPSNTAGRRSRPSPSPAVGPTRREPSAPQPAWTAVNGC